jgi:hypothetical protein
MTMTTQLVPEGNQARWDSTFQRLGRSAPAQRADESETDYLRRLSRVAKKYIPRDEDITRVRFDHTLPDNVVRRFSEMAREALLRSMTRTDNLRPGEFRQILETDENTGQQIRKFYGPRSFTDEFMGRVQRVTRINAPATTALYQSAKAESRGLW